MEQIRVVIIGGGFTVNITLFTIVLHYSNSLPQGFTVASILDPMPLFHVTLIDAKGTNNTTVVFLKKIITDSHLFTV